MRVLVTGGCGFVGSVLVPKLLEAGHEVIVFDIQWFGNFLVPHPHLSVIRGDIRELWKFTINVPQTIIHLAGVANDPTGDLDPKLTWEVNALATMQLADQAARMGVAQFIYASSGSVYGVSDAPEVTENTPLHPLSEYNKTKMVAERVLLSYANQLKVQIVRPAMVCGFSPRMRLDVAVNAITMMALEKGHIEINGGKQMRPNIHIDDMTDLYLFLLARPQLTGIYNAGFDNLKIEAIAAMVAERLGVGVTALPVVDVRSYRLNSDRLLATGFKPKKTVVHAIDELIRAHQIGQLVERDEWYNLRTMKKAA